MTPSCDDLLSERALWATGLDPEYFIASLNVSLQLYFIHLLRSSRPNLTKKGDGNDA